MRIIAVCECANGNPSIGSMWLETKSFESNTPIGEIVEWSNKLNGGEGKLIITVDGESPKQNYIFGR